MIGYPLSSLILVYYSLGSGFQNLRVSYCMYGESSGGYLGWSIAKAGDTNNDGKGDVLISELYQGVVYLIFGRETATDVNVASLTSGEEGYKIVGNGWVERYL